MDFKKSSQFKECIEWIEANNYVNIALQFPQTLLKYVPSVVRFLKLSTKRDCEYFVVYSDNCSVDHLSPLHLGEDAVDAVIRFGKVCLASVPETITEFPVFFVFDFVNDENQLYEFTKENLETIDADCGLSDCLLVYEAWHANVINKLISDGIVCEENVAKLKCSSSKWCFPSDVKCLLSSSSDGPTFGEFLVSKELENFRSLVFIGSTIGLYYRVSNFKTVIQLKLIEKEIVKIIPAKEMRKRMALIEKVKSNSCSKVGVVFTNSYPSLNSVVDHIKHLSKKKRKEIYFISLVQSTDECKLANFGELNALVVINQCHCSWIIDNIKLHIPLLNLVEYEISCGLRREYAGIQWEAEDGEFDEIGGGQIVQVEPLDKRLWFGLEINAHFDEPSIIKEGQKGIASGYDTEPTS